MKDNMQIIDIQNKFCISCMETHDVKKVKIEEENIYKDVDVKYFAIYDYCDRTGDYWAEGSIIDDNFKAMKNAYNKNVKG